MAAESNTPVDIEIWIEKVINSCETYQQVLKVKKLIRLYLKRLRDEGLSDYIIRSVEEKLVAIEGEQRNLIVNGAKNLMRG
jgi:hypothetical protein